MTQQSTATERREPRLSAFFSPISELSPESPLSVTAELGSQLRRDEADAYRQVLGRHHWLRVGIALIVGAAAAIGGSVLPPAWLGAALAAYVALVLGAWFAVRPGQRVSPPAAVTAAVATVAGDVLLPLVLVSGEPASLLRVLVIGAMVTWAAGYFFSWRFGVGAALGFVIVYAVAALAVAAPGANGAFHAANLALFAVVAGVVTWTLARQRRFHAELHVFCRQVALGDIGIRLPLASSASGNAVVRLARDIDLMRKGLAEQIGVDALTGCLNRRALESRLRGEWRLARRRRSVVAVAAVDVDRFKQVNDTHGHAVGDDVLQQLARIMKECARESDAVARMGGDEFVMILPDTNADGARAVAERVRERVGQTRFGTPERPLTVTVSVGAVALAGTDDMEPHEVLNLADRALYRSKQAGRNRVSLG